MNRQRKRLVVGIGSPHGDDISAWRLMEELKPMVGSTADLRKAASPHDLLDWLDGIEHLDVVDACQSKDPVCCYDLSAGVGGTDRAVPVRMHATRDEVSTGFGTIPKTRSLCTHQFDLVQTLELAETLQKLPDIVRLWTLASEDFAPGSELSATSNHSVELAKQLLVAELDG